MKYANVLNLIKSVCESPRVDYSTTKPINVLDRQTNRVYQIRAQNVNKEGSKYAAKARSGSRIAWFFYKGKYLPFHYEDGQILDRKGEPWKDYE